MSNNVMNELDRMQHLMNYGINESSKKQQGQSVVEYHQVGADGNTYGIIRESSKFYIKVAPKKDTEILAEDYDYIGGYMNKKEHEYSSYALASKQFGLKMKSINEAVGKKSKNVINEQANRSESAEWQVNETKEMRAELERFRQISNNVDYILSEDKSEKALQLGDPRNVTCEGGDPYTETPDSTEKVNGMKENSTDPKKADSTYKEKGEYKEEIKGNEHEDPKTADDTFNHKVGKIESEGKSVATAKGASNKNDKGVKMNEGHIYVLSEEQVLAWNRAVNYMDTSKGTEIGDSAPYTDKVPEEETNQEMNEETSIAMGGDNMNQHTAKVGDTAPFDEKTGKENLKETEIGPDGLPTNTPENDSTMLTDSEFEGATKVNEATLDVFGKHPAYQKVPFETPANTEIDKWGRDWNDASAKGDKPFGTEIGHGGDPFSEKVVDMLTDAVLDRLKKKSELSERKVLKVPNAGSPDIPAMPEPLAQGGGDNLMIGGSMPTENDGQMMPPTAEMPPMGNDAQPNQFDANFDAGIEADEESDPKKYIQQLTGKLSQSLRKYNEGLPQPDADLNKYVAGMVVKQCIEGLPQEDVKEILDKVNSDEEEDIEQDANQPEMGGGTDAIPQQEAQPMPQMNETNSTRQSVANRYREFTSDDAKSANDKVTDRGAYHKKPWVGKTFKS